MHVCICFGTLFPISGGVSNMNSSQREITHIISVNTSVDIRIPTYKIRSITTNNIKQLLNTIKYHYVQSKKGQIKKMLQARRNSYLNRKIKRR